MFRAPNPFDTRIGHAAQRLASGGANCSTCSSCCSSVVSAVAVTVLSSRMVAKAPPPETAGGPARPTHRGLRIAAAALLPISTVAVALCLIAAATISGHPPAPWLVPALLLLVPLGAGLRFATRGNRWLRWKLALLSLIVFPLLIAAEMAAWINWVVN